MPIRVELWLCDGKKVNVLGLNREKELERGRGTTMDHELTLAAARKAVAKIIKYKFCGELSLLGSIHKRCRLKIRNF